MRGCLAAVLVLFGLILILPGLCFLSMSGGRGGGDGSIITTIGIVVVGAAFVLLVVGRSD